MPFQENAELKWPKNGTLRKPRFLEYAIVKTKPKEKQ